MSDNKKYYYLKLKDDFFDSEEIKVLEGMDNGYKYSNILLKMYLKSIKREGLLIFNERIPYNPKMIATVTNHNINDVKQALVLFQEMGLIETLSNGAIYMLDIQNFIGKSTTEADRIRAYRNKIEEKKELLLQGESVELASICTNVQQMNNKCTPEIEIEIEKEKELEKELDIEKEDSVRPKQIPYQQIQDEFNKTCTTLPSIKSLNGNRKNTLRVWYNTLENGIDDVIAFFKRVNASDFLSGRNDKWSNCNFDWIIKPANRQKIIEGNYDNRQDTRKEKSSNPFLEMLQDMEDEESKGVIEYE